MTDEELDNARANEAIRLSNNPEFSFISVIETAARLARENWRPVDPDLIKAREICANEYPLYSQGYRKGNFDKSVPLRVAIAGIVYGKSLDKS